MGTRNRSRIVIGKQQSRPLPPGKQAPPREENLLRHVANQPSPQACSARSILDSTVSCEVTERQGLGWQRARVSLRGYSASLRCWRNCSLAWESFGGEAALSVVCCTAVFSVVTQRSSQWGGALRDDTKNGCVADYAERRRREKILQSVSSPFSTRHRSSSAKTLLS